MLKKIWNMVLRKKLKRKYSKINTIIYSNSINDDLKCGEGCIIGSKVFIEKGVEIGNFTYLNSGNSYLHIDSYVKIGNYCSIAPSVSIGMGNHYTSFVSTHPILYNRYYAKFFDIDGKQKLCGLQDENLSTNIGNDVWIGSNAWIKRGVSIGDGAIIAAGAVVTKNVPCYSIFGGVPAKQIGKRFSDFQIKSLMNINEHWWTWSKEKLSRNFELLYDVDDYITFQNHEIEKL